MGDAGMADMGEMAMPGPANTLPMMSGEGQFGPAEMGGMFALIKVREDLAANDYRDPGQYQHPAGSVAHEVGTEGDAPGTGGPRDAMPPGVGSAGGGRRHHH